MKVAVCQLNILEGKVEENISLIENTLKSLSDETFDLICLPELCITGYDFESVKNSTVDERKLFSDLAKKYNVNLFAGYAYKEGDSYYDMASVWKKDGSEALAYKKIHLWGDERAFFQHGDEVAVGELDGVKIGVMICADLGFADLPKIMALKGCQLMICPAAWSYPFQNLYKLMTRARAAENQMFAISINRASGMNGFCGNSSISDPDGEIISQSDSVEQEILKVEFDPNIVAQKREATPWLKMRLPEVYEKNYKDI